MKALRRSIRSEDTYASRKQYFFEESPGRQAQEKVFAILSPLVDCSEPLQSGWSFLFPPGLSSHNICLKLNWMNPCLNQWFSEQMSLFLLLPLTLQLTQSSFPTRCPHLPLLVFHPSLTSLLLDQMTIFSFSSFLTPASPPSPDCPSHFKNVASLSPHDITRCRFFSFFSSSPCQFALLTPSQLGPSIPVSRPTLFPCGTPILWSPIFISFRSHRTHISSQTSLLIFTLL